MPRMTDNMDDHGMTTSTYGYSAVNYAKLGSTDQTLVSIFCDRSGSTGPFTKQAEDVLKTVVDACRLSPRADSLLLRVCAFSDRLEEIHGFKPLADCAKGDYDGSLPAYGMTALFDAVVNGLESTADYAGKLYDQSFNVNAIMIVLTDGLENASALGVHAVNLVMTQLQDSVELEKLESFVSILVGLGVQGNVAKELENFSKDGGFGQYIFFEDVTQSKMAKLANFISQSISAQSQALGTGGPSKSLSF